MKAIVYQKTENNRVIILDGSLFEFFSTHNRTAETNEYGELELKEFELGAVWQLVARKLTSRSKKINSLSKNVNSLESHF